MNKKPKPKPKPKHEPPHRKPAHASAVKPPQRIAAAEKENAPMNDPMTVDPAPVTQSDSTEASPLAHVDPAAQQQVQAALNERVVRETKVPFIPPELPPGLSPNEAVTLVAKGAIQIPPQTDQPPPEPEPEPPPDGETPPE